MNGVRQKFGRMPVATRPAVVPLEYCDEISPDAFAKIRESVKDLNDPSRKRTMVDGIDWPEDN